jgi:hypothetical protein
VRKWKILILMSCCWLSFAWAGGDGKLVSYDPTKPAFQLPKQISEQTALTLSMIVLSGDKRYAIINGSMVFEGDALQGYQVSSIRKQSVLLEGINGIKRQLRLVRSVIRTSSTLNKE